MILRHNKTKVYFSDYCIHCSNLKEWLRKNDIPFTALNTEDPEVSKELADRGVQAIPFTVITNEETGETQEIVGFHKSKFEEIFSL